MLVMNLALSSGIAALMAAAAGNSSIARLFGNRASNRQVTVVIYWVVPVRVVGVVGEPHHHGRGYAALAASCFDEGARLESGYRSRD